MVRLAITTSPSGKQGACGVCGAPVASGSGPRLALVDSPAAVCGACGKRHAPHLAALLDLAHTAERVGHIGRHTLVPPLEVLLHLTQAADAYAEAIGPAAHHR
jgi:hypothetical protein